MKKDPKWLEPFLLTCRNIIAPKIPGPGHVFLKGCGAKYSDWDESVRMRVHAENCQVFNAKEAQRAFRACGLPTGNS